MRVAGVDSSTQSCKVVVCDLESGAVEREARAPHPDGTEVDPEAWWEALEQASSTTLPGADAVAVAGQQHGMVALDGSGSVVRPALLWNDNRSAQAAVDLTDALGGSAAWAQAVGSTLVASFTVTKLRWLATHEPALAESVSSVLLPHDWLTWRLGSDGMVTDRGDASGTGYWSPRTGEYRSDLMELALGHRFAAPSVVGPADAVGHTASGAVIGPGTGDNMAAALGLGIGSGDVVVSLGTSGTAFAVSDAPAADPSGYVAGFADATGRYLPLVCTLNAARVLDATAGMLGISLDELSRVALEAAPGCGGVTMLPYLDGERTPALPDASGSLFGLRRANMTPANIARSAFEGVLCGLADGVDALVAQGVTPTRVLLIGGAARSDAVREIAPQIFGVDVVVPAPAEYVAIGAARQAAWVLTGELPEWPVTIERSSPARDTDAGAAVRATYDAWRRDLHGV